MIIDCRKNHALYPFGPLWTAAFDFLETVTPDMENGKTLIQGDDLFAVVDSYNTKERNNAKLETHRKYIDIQVLLSGTERLEIFPKNGLAVSEPYNAGKEAEFYQVPPEPLVQVTLRPDQFIVFFPEDAHMPCLMAGDSPQPVKKVVIKLRADSLI